MTKVLFSHVVLNICDYSGRKTTSKSQTDAIIMQPQKETLVLRELLGNFSVLFIQIPRNISVKLFGIKIAVI